jgi:hypothetical protein
VSKPDVDIVDVIDTVDVEGKCVLPGLLTYRLADWPVHPHPTLSAVDFTPMHGIAQHHAFKKVSRHIQRQVIECRESELS